MEPVNRVPVTSRIHTRTTPTNRFGSLGDNQIRLHLCDLEGNRLCDLEDAGVLLLNMKGHEQERKSLGITLQ